jgi:hypothetical protein
MSAEILDIRESVEIDDSIGSFEYVEKDTDQGVANLNTPGELTITFNGQNTWMCPGESYLIVEGFIQINTAAPALWADAQGTAVSFINNGLMFMFDNVKYYLGSQLIEYFQYAGVTTTLHNYLTKSRTYSGLDWMWYPDEYIDQPILKNRGFGFRNLALRPLNADAAAQPSPPNYYFSCAIPLENIFNFCHDYKKVMIGVEHKISLVKQSTNICLMRNSAAAAGNAVAAAGMFPALTTTANNAANVTTGDAIVNLTKLRWAMPYVVPNPSAGITLGEIIKSSAPVDITFLNKKTTVITVTPGATTINWTPRLISGGVERPRYVICAFQCNRGFGTTNVQQVAQLTAPAAAGGAVNIGNSATFSPGYQINVTDAYVTVNGTRYPYASTATDFSTNKYAKWYRKYVEFYDMYNGNDKREPCLTMQDFYAFNTIYVFDVSKQPPPVTNSTTDIVVNFVLGGLGAPAATNLFIMVYYDSKFIAHGENGDRQVVQLVSALNTA